MTCPLAAAGAGLPLIADAMCRKFGTTLISVDAIHDAEVGTRRSRGAAGARRDHPAVALPADATTTPAAAMSSTVTAAADAMKHHPAVDAHTLYPAAELCIIAELGVWPCKLA